MTSCSQIDIPVIEDKLAKTKDAIEASEALLGRLEDNRKVLDESIATMPDGEGKQVWVGRSEELGRVIADGRSATLVLMKIADGLQIALSESKDELEAFRESVEVVIPYVPAPYGALIGLALGVVVAGTEAYRRIRTSRAAAKQVIMAIQIEKVNSGDGTVEFGNPEVARRLDKAMGAAGKALVDTVTGPQG